MRKIRRMCAFMLAVMLVVTMGATVKAADAAPKGKISVTSTNPEFNKKKINAVQVFSATVSGTGAGQAISYKLNTEFEKFFTGATDDKYGCSGRNGEALSNAAYEYVSKLAQDSPDLIDLAAALQDYVADATNNITPETSTAGASLIGDKYEATIDPLDYGYYLIYPEGGSTSESRHTDAHLLSLTNSLATIALKSEYPTVEKKITDGNNSTDTASAQIGDTITFTLTSKVPDMTDYSSYTFKFKDTLSKGLTFVGVQSVTIDGAVLTADTGYSVTSDTTDPTQTGITVEFTDFYKNHKDKAGKTIVVTYTATLNENAIVGTTGNANSAVVEYSNNPQSSTTGTSTPDIVYIYTFDITIDKYTGDYAQNSTRLPDAVFGLRTAADEKGTTLSLLEKTPGSDSDMAVYQVVPTGTTNAVKQVTTTGSGKIQINGLKEGIYYLHEITAPSGYNKLAEPIQVVISATKDAEENITGATVKYGFTSASTADFAEATNGVVAVQNNSGTILPETGGLGTLILAICGAGFVIFGLIRRNRKLKDTL